MLKKNFKIKGGYTIIETMIAVSLFIIIVMMGMGALLNANVLHQKSQNMRSIIDNLSFIMEDMSRTLRTGYAYDCYPADGSGGSLVPASSFPARSCADGWAIVFEPARGSTSVSTDQWAYYLSGDDINGIGKIFKSTDGAQTWTQLTPNEVDIDQTSFFAVVGAEGPATNSQQPFVTIKLIGKITYKNVITPFSLQTSISQRNIDR